MTALLRRFTLFLILAGCAAAARADQADIAASARGVVRVAIVASNGSEIYFVGHGTGFAVAPDKVLTNAHVVELTRSEKNLVIGIVPSEGKRSYGGHVVAYSPGNDLALIQLDEGRLPPGSFYAGAVSDGQHVTAIGYPGAVDRAQGLGLKDMVEPMTAVKTGGNVSSGRSGKAFDTILHTAPLAAGNSGGPLVDDCGRILGVNSFGSVSDGRDAEYGFAVSNREVASFLRQAGVSFLHTTAACRSLAEVDDADARLLATQAAKQDATRRALANSRNAALEKARDAAEQDVISSRENAMALAAVLLALSVLALGWAGLGYTQGKRKSALWSAVGGGALLSGALFAFVLRPSFSTIEDRIAQPAEENAPSTGYAATGDNLCRIDQGRSRITVSALDDVPLRWSEGGCVNGKTQFLAEGTAWTRIFARTAEDAIVVSSFEPTTATFRNDRYLADADTLEKARALRAKFTGGACTADPDAMTALAQAQAELRATLPMQPNERLVYHCVKGKPPAPAPIPAAGAKVGAKD